MLPTKTMWKYPTPVYNGKWQGFNADDQNPDCKMYFMILAVLIIGKVVDLGQDMHGFHFDDPDQGHVEGPIT